MARIITKPLPTTSTVRLAWTAPNTKLGRPWRAEVNRHRYEISRDQTDRYVVTQIAPTGQRTRSGPWNYLRVAKTAADELATQTIRSQAGEI